MRIAKHCVFAAEREKRIFGEEEEQKYDIFPPTLYYSLRTDEQKCESDRLGAKQMRITKMLAETEELSAAADRQ